ncbi:MAG: hypothetical protein Q9227_006033 [Pyrenula ochraceoflavens]
MPPRGVAILLGAGPTSGAGLARVFAASNQGNLAVALLARNPDNLSSLTTKLRSSVPSGVFKDFPADAAEPDSLNRAFDAIRKWNAEELGNLDLKLAVWHVKHTHKKPFEEETTENFSKSLGTYVTGAMAFAKLCTTWMLVQGAPSSEDGKMTKCGTLIFTGTLGSLRTNAGFAAYGAGRAGVRMLAQSLAREYSPKGMHVVHTIANGGIGGEDGAGQEEKRKFEAGAKMKAESVGQTYLWLEGQGADLFTHELDLRPAAEKF